MMSDYICINNKVFSFSQELGFNEKHRMAHVHVWMDVKFSGRDISCNKSVKSFQIIHSRVALNPN